MKTTEYRQTLRYKILDVAMAAFHENGIVAVSMDSIARKLAISKRTLYELYANKEELLLEGMRRYDEQHESHLSAFQEGHNVIEVVAEYYRLLIKDEANVSPTFYADIHRYSRLVVYFEERRIAHQTATREFFLRGVKDGFFRGDVDFDVTSVLGEAFVRHFMQTEMYKHYSMSHIFRNVVFVCIKGICTAKGAAELDMLLAENAKKP